MVTNTANTTTEIRDRARVDAILRRSEKIRDRDVAAYRLRQTAELLRHAEEIRQHDVAAKAFHVTAIWEYWEYDGSIYRNPVGSRGYINECGIPANSRWECSRDHFDIFHGTAK